MDKIVKGISGVTKHSKTSSILKIADIVIKTGFATVGAVLPDAAYEFSKFGLGKLRDYIHGRDDQRIYEFHKKLLYLDDVVDAEILKGEIEEANYHALLNACLSDIEDEKTIPYANLTRAIALGKVSNDLKRHYVLSLKDIAWEDLDFLRQAYVISNNPIIPSSGNGNLSSRDFLVQIPSESVRALSVRNLTAKGFVDGQKLTAIGVGFVKACSEDDDLTPGAYDYRVWTGQSCDNYLLDDSAGAARVQDLLQSDLRSIGVNSNTPMEGMLDGRREKNIFTTCASIIYRRGKILEDLQLENLKFLLGTNPVVQIVIDDNNSDSSELLLPEDFVVISNDDSRVGVQEAIEKLVRKINAQHETSKNLKRP
ncbi:hypothetical protein ACYZUC_01105 [Pseudomonas sp. GT1P32]